MEKKKLNKLFLGKEVISRLAPEIQRQVRGGSGGCGIISGKGTCSCEWGCDPLITNRTDAYVSCHDCVYTEDYQCWSQLCQ